MSDANVCPVCRWASCRCENISAGKVFIAVESKKGIRGVVHLSMIGAGHKTVCGIKMADGGWKNLAMAPSTSLWSMGSTDITCVKCKHAMSQMGFSLTKPPEEGTGQHSGPFITTYTGIEIVLSCSQPYQISLTDIARSLAGIRRFNGHLRRRISIAHHSIAVARIVESRSRSKDVVLYALLHDAHEAYMGDLVTPLKQELGNVHRGLEWSIQRAILRALCPESVAERGWESKAPDLVKEADRLALNYEASQWLNAKWATMPSLNSRTKAAYLLSEDDAEVTFREMAIELGAKP